MVMVISNLTIDGAWCTKLETQKIKTYLGLHVNTSGVPIRPNDEVGSGVVWIDSNNLVALFFYRHLDDVSGISISGSDEVWTISCAAVDLLLVPSRGWTKGRNSNPHARICEKGARAVGCWKITGLRACYFRFLHGATSSGVSVERL